MLLCCALHGRSKRGVVLKDDSAQWLDDRARWLFRVLRREPSQLEVLAFALACIGEQERGVSWHKSMERLLWLMSISRGLFKDLGERYSLDLTLIPVDPDLRFSELAVDSERPDECGGVEVSFSPPPDPQDGSKPMLLTQDLWSTLFPDSPQKPKDIHDQDTMIVNDDDPPHNE